MRIFLKAILLVVVLWVGLGIFTVMRISGFGMLPLAIVGIATLAAVKAIWSYKPSSSKEVRLNKEQSVNDYYILLNVSPSASKGDIKKAYKREASKWHPDRNNSPEATERMQLINEAYLILSDSEARSRYDKELERYYEFKRRNNYQQKARKHSANSNSHESDKYKFNDELLKSWINKAKLQARDLAKQSLDDLVGMSKAASKSAWDATKGYILVLVILLSLLALI